MTKLSTKYFHRAARLAVLTAMAAGLGAWDDGSDRTEFVTRGVGDAVEVNKATQTINPWPPYVKDRRLRMDGKRAGLAMQRYQANRSLLPHPLSPVKAAEVPVTDPTNAQLPAAQPQQ